MTHPCGTGRPGKRIVQEIVDYARAGAVFMLLSTTGG